MLPTCSNVTIQTDTSTQMTTCVMVLITVGIGLMNLTAMSCFSLLNWCMPVTLRSPLTCHMVKRLKLLYIWHSYRENIQVHFGVMWTDSYMCINMLWNVCSCGGQRRTAIVWSTSWWNSHNYQRQSVGRLIRATSNCIHLDEVESLHHSTD